MEFRYKDLINLGFKRTDCNDGVFFDTYGVTYFIVNYVIEYKKYDYIFDWCQNKRTVTLQKCDKNGNIKLKGVVENIDTLHFLIDVLKKTSK